MPLVARNPVIGNSEAKISVYTSSLSICSIGTTFVMRPSFFARRVVVRSHHHLRRLITKDTALEMRWSGRQNYLLSDAGCYKASDECSLHRIQKWLTGCPARHHAETITEVDSRVCKRFL